MFRGTPDKSSRGQYLIQLQKMKGQRSEGKTRNGPSAVARSRPPPPAQGFQCLFAFLSQFFLCLLEKKTYTLQNTHKRVKEVFKRFFTQHPARSVVNTLPNKPTHTSKSTIYLFLPRTSASRILVRVSFRLDFAFSNLTVSITVLMGWFGF